MHPSSNDPLSAHVQMGDVLGGRYQVVRLIGRGGMGVVVEARHLEHDQRVAVKVLHPKHLENQEAVARFIHEGRAAARIRGEHAARLLDMGTSGDGCPFLVMELLEGRDLASVLSLGRVSVEDAAYYILQACEGMAEVHAHGIVHRDLKPSNLFLTQRLDGSPLVKVLDFGIAKGVAAADPSELVLTQTLVAMGTPLYMSPEQIRSSREVDARTDVWSLGTIFYELVTGRAAFGGNTVTHITAQVLENEPLAPSKVVPGLPPEVDAVVAGALRKHPDERTIDVAALAAALEPLAGARGAGASARCARILQGALRPDLVTTPPVARDDALGGTMRFDPRRRRRMVQGAVAALALVAAGLVGAAFSAYRGTDAAFGQTLARRGVVRVRSTGARAVELASRPEPSPSAPAPVGSSTTTIASPAGPSPSAPSSPSGSAAAGPRPAPRDAGRFPGPPSAPAAPPPADRPFDPFAERN